MLRIFFFLQLEGDNQVYSFSLNESARFNVFIIVQSSTHVVLNHRMKQRAMGGNVEACDDFGQDQVAEILITYSSAIQGWHILVLGFKMTNFATTQRWSVPPAFCFIYLTFQSMLYFRFVCFVGEHVLIVFVILIHCLTSFNILEKYT